MTRDSAANHCRFCRALTIVKNSDGQFLSAGGILVRLWVHYAPKAAVGYRLGKRWPTDVSE